MMMTHYDELNLPRRQVSAGQNAWSLPRINATVTFLRREIRGLAGQVLDAELAADVALAASELMTNAVQHGSGVHLHVRVFTDAGVRVEVQDGGTEGRAKTPPEPVNDNGRGLVIVSAVTDAWGEIRHPGGGRTVWFEIEVKTS